MIRWFRARMIVNTFCLVILGIVLLSNTCLAKQYKKDGYAIDLRWQQKKIKDRFLVLGDVRGGQKCSQLNLSIFFTNTGDSSRAHVEAVIYKYQSLGSFKAEDRVYASRKYRNQWHVDGLYIECMQH